MFKNTASQKWYVFAFDETDNTPKTGDAAQITAKVAKDYAAAVATDDTNPTETEDGYYTFDLTQAETNADTLMLLPESSTSNIQVIGCPATIFTRPPYFTSLGIESDGDLTKVNTLDGHTAQTADHTTGIADIPTVAEFEARSLAAAAYTIVADLGVVQTGDSFARIGALGAGLTAITDYTDLVTAARMGALTDWINGGRLDLILDELTVQGDTNESAIGTAQADLDIITGTAGALLDTTATSPQLVDDVWDEVLTAAAHNVASSAGRRLRNLAAAVIRYETAQAGANSTITLDTGASAIDQIYTGNNIVIVDGTGVEQKKAIVNYNGTTKVATINGVWFTNPDSTSEFVIIARCDTEHTGHGIAQAGAVGSITLAADASAVDNFYTDHKIHIVTGTGAEEVRLITDYNGTTKVASVTPNWVITPDATSVYHTGIGSRSNVALIDNVVATMAINTEADAALADIHLDHLFAADYDPASKPGTASALLNELIENDGGVSRFTENALEQAPSGTGASAATIADAVWEEAIADHSTSTTFGGKNQKVVPSETIADYKATGFSTHAAADVWAVVARTLTANTNFNDITAADVKAAIEAAGSHLALIKTQTDDLANGERLDLLIDAIKVVTDAIPNNGAMSDLADIKTQVGTAGSGLTDGVGMSTGMKAEVNAEMLDVLAVDTHAEPGQGAPGATISIAAKINYLYKFLRNKITNDGADIKVYNDAGDTVDQKAVVSEVDDTVTRNEFGTGA